MTFPNPASIVLRHHAAPMRRERLTSGRTIQGAERIPLNSPAVILIDPKNPADEPGVSGGRRGFQPPHKSRHTVRPLGPEGCFSPAPTGATLFPYPLQPCLS